MFVIPFETINTEMRTNSWQTEYARYNDCMAKLHNNERLSKENFDFMHDFTTRMGEALCLMCIDPDVAAYYRIREALASSGLSPEDFDNSVFCNMYVANSAKKFKIPADYQNIDEDTLESYGYIPSITKIVSNKPDTAVYFNDNTYVTVRCEEDEPFDAEKGIYLAILKKAIGPKHLRNLFNIIAAAEAEEQLIEKTKAEKAARKAEALRPKTVASMPCVPETENSDTKSEIDELTSNDNTECSDTEFEIDEPTPDNDTEIAEPTPADDIDE